jgi:Starch-binding associating with outer membrane
MKRITYKILAAATAVVLITGGESCKKLEKFPEGINVDPNTTPTPITAALLSNVEANLSQLAVDINGRGGLYAQYFSETQYTDASLYSPPEFNYTAPVYAGTTVNTYSGILFDCQNIINQNTLNAAAAAASGSNKDQIAIAKILKTYIFSTLTDKWGDIPYSEALQGGANIYPKYDTQEDIYKGMLKDLKDAVAGFEAAGAPIKGDIIYGGNIGKWKKLANSLRLILAVRMSKVFPAAGGLAATEAAAALADAGGIISTNADNFTMTYPGGNYRSPWYLVYDGRNDFAISKTITDILSTMNDARRTQFSPTNTGFPYGITRDLAITITSSDKILAASLRDDVNDNVVIVSAATVLLARAEAQERGWISGQGTAEAEISYNAAIDQSYAQWGVGSAAAYYGAGTPANYNTGTGSAACGQNSFGSIVAAQNATTASKLERIALQRYLATFPNGTQAWAEWRRTGIPKLQGTTYAINAGKQICRRYIYGQSEIGLNPTNVAAAIARLSGGNTADARIWWDKP